MWFYYRVILLDECKNFVNIMLEIRQCYNTPVTQDLPKPILITHPRELHALAVSLAQEPVVAVDTESNSLYVYKERVCLLQFSTPTQDYLVDPLALDDLSSLAPVFASPQILKIFHAAEYDLVCLRRDYGFQFANLFDTMEAARILGWKQFGLGSILEAEFGVKMDKKYQRANWGERPLNPQLMNYARLDTRYLIPLRERLEAALHTAGRWELAQEDFQRACLPPAAAPAPNDELMFYRISGVHDLAPREVAVLQALCLYRDEMAQILDRPWFKVIGDSTLVTIAQIQPRSIIDLRQVEGMTPGQIHRYSQGLLDAVRRGLKAPPIKVSRTPRPENSYLERVEAIRNWRKQAGAAMGVESGVILPRDIMYAIIDENPRDLETLQRLMQQVPWRFQNFGEHILRVLQHLSH